MGVGTPLRMAGDCSKGVRSDGTNMRAAEKQLGLVVGAIAPHLTTWQPLCIMHMHRTWQPRSLRVATPLGSCLLTSLQIVMRCQWCLCRLSSAVM